MNNKKLTYLATLMLLTTGASTISTPINVYANQTNILSSSTDSLLYNNANSKYKTAKASSDYINELILNTDSLSKSITSETDVSKQLDILNDLSNKSQTVVSFAQGQLQDDVNSYQKTLDSYNNYLKDNQLTTTQPNSIKASNPEISAFIKSISSYQSDIAKYIEETKSILEKNKLSSDAANEVNKAGDLVNSDVQKITDLKTQIDQLIKEQAQSVDGIKNATSSDEVAALVKKGEEAKTNLDSLLEQYKVAYTQYIKDVVAYNNTIDTINEKKPDWLTAPVKIDEDISKFDSVWSSASEVILKNDESLHHNADNSSDYIDLKPYYNDAKTAYDQFKSDVDKQNTDVKALAEIVSAFPMSSCTAGSPESTQILEEWEASYKGAADQLVTDIKATNSSKDSYQAALDAYNTAGVGNPFFVPGPTVATDLTTNPAQDYLDQLQTPMNTSDLTSGSGAVPDAVNKYLQNQTIFDDSNNVKELHDKAVTALLNLRDQIESVKVNSDDLHSLCASITSVPPTEDTVTTATHYISTLQNIYTTQQSILEKIKSLVPIAGKSYQDYKAALTNYNSLPEVLANPSYALTDDKGLLTIHNALNGALTSTLGLTGLEGQAAISDHFGQHFLDCITQDINSDPATWFNWGSYPYDPAVDGVSDETFVSWMQKFFEDNALGSVYEVSSWQKGYDSALIQINVDYIFSTFPSIPGTPEDFTLPDLDYNFIQPEYVDLVPNKVLEPTTPDFVDSVSAEVITGITSKAAVPNSQEISKAPSIQGININPVYPIEENSSPIPDIPNIPDDSDNTSDTNSGSVNTKPSLPETGQKSGMPLLVSGTLFLGIALTLLTKQKRNKTRD